MPPATVSANLSRGVSTGLYAMSTTTLAPALERDEGRNSTSGTCSSVVVADGGTVETMTLDSGPYRDVTSSVSNSLTLASGIAWTSSSGTALHYAAFCGLYDVARLLVPRVSFLRQSRRIEGKGLVANPRMEKPHDEWGTNEMI